jgi:anti-sigma regulatory factor (Ser/Thr protein kinase)
MEALTTSLRPHQIIPVTQASDIAQARRAGQALAQELGFDETRSGQLALLISEAATNIIKHAGDGRVFLSAVVEGERTGVDVLAVDAGPGIGNLGLALRDGVSSVGTAGTGLGAMRRLADEFDVFAPRDKGSVFFMRLWATVATPAATAKATPAPFTFGALSLPIASEDSNGDGWALASDRAGLALMSIDGLGHGELAAAAALAALECMAREPFRQPAVQIEASHVALRATRGAAMAVAQLAYPRMAGEAPQLRFAGIGNIAACLIDPDDGASGVAVGRRRQMISHNGIVGHNMRKVQQFELPCPAGCLLIMHSDGLSTQWDLNTYAGLAACHPLVIAAVLLRDFGRARDDASVLVLRYHGGA